MQKYKKHINWAKKNIKSFLIYYFFCNFAEKLVIAF